MSITLTEKTVGLWFVMFEGHDWLCALERSGDGFELTHRHRYYHHPTDAWDDKDTKNWYRLKSEDHTREFLIEMIRSMVDGGMRLGAKEQYEVLRGADETLEAFTQRFTALPFVSKREATPEQAAVLKKRFEQP